MCKVLIETERLCGNAFRTNSSRLVWFCLLREVDESGIVAVSASAIARDVGVNEKTVRNILSEFLSEGIIEALTPNKSPNEIPNKTPKKVRGVERLIRLIGTYSYIGRKNDQLRKKSEQKSEPNSEQKSEAEIAQSTAPADGFTRFMEYFNNAVSGTEIPRITKLTDARKKALRSIFKAYGKEAVEAVIQKVIASDFLCRDWGKVGFDWMFKKENFIKILEGNYDNRTKPIITTDNAATRKAGRDHMLGLANRIVSQSSDKLFSLYNGDVSDADNRKD